MRRAWPPLLVLVTLALLLFEFADERIIERFFPESTVPGEWAADQEEFRRAERDAEASGSSLRAVDKSLQRLAGAAEFQLLWLGQLKRCPR